VILQEVRRFVFPRQCSRPSASSCVTTTRALVAPADFQ
jgi:hypothetical protein